jgi:P-type Cu+ transporter
VRGRQERERQREIDELRRRWMVQLRYIRLPLDAMDILMPALLVVATGVQFWAVKSLHTAASAAAKDGTSNFETIVDAARRGRS